MSWNTDTIQQELCLQKAGWYSCTTTQGGTKLGLSYTAADIYPRRKTGEQQALAGPKISYYCMLLKICPTVSESSFITVYFFLTITSVAAL